VVYTHAVTGAVHEEPQATAPARAPLRERKQQKTRELIVAAAYDLFAEHGYANVTINDIADATDVSRATFFRYFGDKQEVVFASEAAIRADLIRQTTSPHPPPKSLAECVERLRDILMPVLRKAEAAPHYKLHAQLVREHPELHDRHMRKLLSFAEVGTNRLEAQDVDPATARLAAQLVVACYLAADPDGGSADGTDRNLGLLAEGFRGPEGR
jgi:AcrR family transcriptional regulator